MSNQSSGGQAFLGAVVLIVIMLLLSDLVAASILLWRAV